MDSWQSHDQKPMDEVDHLLLNARLRDELEPFLDESVDFVNFNRLPTPEENDYLASMLAWERAPVEPIANWFDPPLILPSPESLSQLELHEVLWDTIRRLYDKQIVLDFTDHLSDHDLYCLILRDILPSHEKKLGVSTRYLHWHCLDPTEDPETWLRFYASDEERRSWSIDTGETPPSAEPSPFNRRMPRRMP